VDFWPNSVRGSFNLLPASFFEKTGTLPVPASPLLDVSFYGSPGRFRPGFLANSAGGLAQYSLMLFTVCSAPTSG
jgi:hypothetical protein